MTCSLFLDWQAYKYRAPATHLVLEKCDGMTSEENYDDDIQGKFYIIFYLNLINNDNIMTCYINSLLELTTELVASWTRSVVVSALASSLSRS